MKKMDIIYVLAKGVYEITGPQSYGHIRRGLIDSQGVSEIALYSAVADHLEENDIDPKNYISDMLDLVKETSKNLFFIKMDDRYHYLLDRFESLSLTNSPEKQGKFLCMRCFTLKKDSERSKLKNYKNCCHDWSQKRVW